jgi:hypothetical protein
MTTIGGAPMGDPVVGALAAALRDSQPPGEFCPELFDRVRGGVRRRRRRRQLAAGVIAGCAAVAALVAVPAAAGLRSPGQQVSASSASASATPVLYSCVVEPQTGDAAELAAYASVAHYWGQRAEPPAACTGTRAEYRKPL